LLVPLPQALQKQPAEKDGREKHEKDTEYVTTHETFAPPLERPSLPEREKPAKLAQPISPVETFSSGLNAVS
jgi:hypothetical protein